ncbi:hypothetical protein [Williamsia muralis]|uniref:hypothetical protein n=1 Tax=Williamsia marianensis TaxID=85044 RepID=UPI0037F78D87
MQSEEVTEKLQLTSHERLALFGLQLKMFEDDLLNEESAGKLASKHAVRKALELKTYEVAKQLVTDLADEGDGQLAESLTVTTSGDLVRDLSARSGELCGLVRGRSRSMLVLIELVTFDPWQGQARWVGQTREKSLHQAQECLDSVAQRDVDRIETELKSLVKAVRRKSVKWGRVAAVSAVGLGLGVATMGAAAPVIGAAIGATAGLSGAAATSAGLATLGGGSLAAGGFGVAGGTALLTGLGAVGGAGAAAAGTRWTQWSGGGVVIDAVKLDLVTRLIIVETEGNDAMARRVVESLQDRLAEVGVRLASLAEQIHELKKQNAKLTTENKELRDRLKSEQAEAQLAEMTLAVVIDRVQAA